MGYRKRTSDKSTSRHRRMERVRKTVRGSAERPRLSVFRSAKHLYAQIIDDDKGVTLAAASTVEKDFPGKKKSGNQEGAKALGKLIAERALAKSIKGVRFDRAGYLYHGRVKALADAAREGGLQF